MTRNEATNYRARLRRLLWEKGIEAILALVPESEVKKIAICEDAKKFGSGRAKLLHGVSGPYISQICGCRKKA